LIVGCKKWEMIIFLMYSREHFVVNFVRMDFPIIKVKERR
jgi:hypothetical protein